MHTHLIDKLAQDQLCSYRDLGKSEAITFSLWTELVIYKE